LNNIIGNKSDSRALLCDKINKLLVHYVLSNKYFARRFNEYLNNHYYKAQREKLLKYITRLQTQ